MDRPGESLGFEGLVSSLLGWEDGVAFGASEHESCRKSDSN